MAYMPLAANQQQTDVSLGVPMPTFSICSEWIKHLCNPLQPTGAHPSSLLVKAMARPVVAGLALALTKPAVDVPQWRGTGFANRHGH